MTRESSLLPLVGCVNLLLCSLLARFERCPLTLRFRRRRFSESLFAAFFGSFPSRLRCFFLLGFDFGTLPDSLLFCLAQLILPAEIYPSFVLRLLALLVEIGAGNVRHRSRRKNISRDIPDARSDVRDLSPCSRMLGDFTAPRMELFVIKALLALRSVVGSAWGGSQLRKSCTKHFPANSRLQLGSGREVRLLRGG